MKELLRKLLRGWKIYKNRTSYNRLYNQMMQKNPELKKYADGEKEWLVKWRQYDKKLSPYAYRIFSRYVGNNMNILPLEIFANVVEPVMTPQKFVEYYGDKNVLPRLVDKKFLPITYLRNINGIYYINDYEIISEENVSTILMKISVDSIIVKPSMEGSGRGVDMFYKNDTNEWVNQRKDKLTLDYLKRTYKENYLIQEKVSQSNYLAQFNSTSVNTIRVAVYRNEKNDVEILGAVLRIGATGSIMDNAHQGGVFCGIDDNGVLGKYVCNYLGVKYEIFNDIDFANNIYKIPNYEQVILFATNVIKTVLHHNIIALDIYMDVDDCPKLIELNVGSFSAWFFQFAGNPTLGKYTHEIMERCRNNYTIGGFTINI